jgi:predicted dehydrogenase
MTKETSRRNFLKKATVSAMAGAAGVAFAGSASAMSASSYRKIKGANDRLYVAVQGLGRRWGAYIPPIARKESNVELVYLCDVMQSALDNGAARMKKAVDYSFKLEKDIRKIIADQQVDAIFMATPDHWHTPGAIMAMQAGKHVYVEKPCSHNPFENEMIVAAQQKYDKIVQMGNQQRSAAESIDIINKIHNGAIGQVYKAVAFYCNGRPEVPKQVKQAPPAGLDWELFQGPSPRKDYTHNTWDYNWHWYGWDFGTAETGNNATHELDIARWALQVEYPKSVDVDAGKYHFVDDGWEMYDTMEATFRFSDNKTIQWDGKSRNAYSTYGPYGRGTIIYGSEGSVFVDRNGYKLMDRKGKVVTDSKSASQEAGTALGGGGDMSTRHAVNFFEAIRGKEKLNSSIAVGAVSQMMTHYANIAYRIGKGFEIDEKTGRAYDRDAMKLWDREYEPGWRPSL